MINGPYYIRNNAFIGCKLDENKQSSIRIGVGHDPRTCGDYYEFVFGHENQLKGFIEALTKIYNKAQEEKVKFVTSIIEKHSNKEDNND